MCAVNLSVLCCKYASAKNTMMHTSDEYLSVSKYTFEQGHFLINVALILSCGLYLLAEITSSGQC